MTTSTHGWLLVSDLDGTLIDGDTGAVDEARVLLDWVRASGGTVAVATARPPHALRRLLGKAISHNYYALCHDGSVLVAMTQEGWSVINEKTLDAAVGSTILGHMREASTSLATLGFTGASLGFQILVDGKLAKVSDSALTAVREGRTIVENASALLEAAAACGALRSLSWFGPTDVVEHVRPALSGHELGRARALSYAETRVPGYSWLDFVAPDVSKGDRLLGLRRAVGCEGPVVALGDGDNDVELFHRAELSFCPSFGSRAAREAANQVVDAIDVGDFIRKLMVLLPRADFGRG